MASGAPDRRRPELLLPDSDHCPCCKRCFTFRPPLFGLPLFGWGLLLAVWAVASTIVLGWHIYRYGVNAESLAYLPLLGLTGAMIFLLPHLMEHSPSGELRGLPIRGYGVMVMLGVVGAVALAVHRGRRMGSIRNWFIRSPCGFFWAGSPERGRFM